MKFHFADGQEVEIKGGGSGSLNIVTTVRKIDGERTMYLGVPSTFDVSAENVSLQYHRLKQIRSKVGDEDNEVKYKKNGWHKLYEAGTREDLLHFTFASTTPSYTMDGYNFYELNLNGISVEEYINNNDDTDYKNNDGENIGISKILNHGRNGICIYIDGVCASNYARFVVGYDEESGYHIA